MRQITPEELAALRQKYPEPQYELLTVNLRMGDIVIRNPTEQEYSLFQSQRLNDDSKKIAFPNLLTMCTVFPEKPDLESALKRWPGIAGNIKVIRALQYIAGEADALEGKG